MTFQLLRGLSVSHRPRWLFEEDTLPVMPDERVETGCIAFVCISEVRGMLRCADAQRQGVYVFQFLCYSGFSHAHGRSEFRSSPFPFSQAFLQYVSTASLVLPIVVLHPPTSKKKEKQKLQKTSADGSHVTPAVSRLMTPDIVSRRENSTEWVFSNLKYTA